MRQAWAAELAPPEAIIVPAARPKRMMTGAHRRWLLHDAYGDLTALIAII